MPLTPNEEKKLREEIRRNLAEQEDRINQLREQQQQQRQRKIESRMRQEIMEEEEEKYFTERGYTKYVNRKGGVEWLTSEEAKKRSSKRRTKKSSKRHKARTRKKIIQISLNIAMVLFAAGLYFYLLKYNPNKSVITTGSLIINTDVRGAQIFVNGTEKRQLFTPDTLNGISRGTYFVSVYKDGYAAWPPMQSIKVEPNRTTVADFILKSSAIMGKVIVTANYKDFRLYIDGLAVPQNPDNTFEVPAGYHIISASKKGFWCSPLHHRILVGKQEVTQINFQFEQEEEPGYLHITSNYSTAYIYLNNQLTGIKANGKPFPVKEGVYEVHLCQNGYTSIPTSELIRITPGEKQQISFHLKPENTVDTLKIVTPNPGASITIDGHLLPYVTPVIDLVLTDGPHFVNLMRGEKLYAEKDVAVEVVKLKDNLLQLNF